MTCKVLRRLIFEVHSEISKIVDYYRLNFLKKLPLETIQVFRE